MSSHIYLDVNELKSIISFNNITLREIDKTMNSFCNAMGTLTMTGWSGAARDNFLIKFTEYKREMRCFYENLNIFNQNLTSILSDARKLVDQGNQVAKKL